MMVPGDSPGTSPAPLWWERDGTSVRCRLCPHQCLLGESKTGICGVRTAEAGILKLPGYGYITAESPDPIEKKPLYHYHPGETVWSVGFTGCNLHCPFCQNHRIARSRPPEGRYTSPEDLIASAVSSGSRMIAYTYSEPTVHFEYLMDCAALAAEAGLLNVLVTNGNLEAEPAKVLLSVMDAVNIDLKSWDPDYYRKVLGGSLDAVKTFIEIAVNSAWTELTTLIVPGDNDDIGELSAMSDWIASLSPDIPYHLSAYHPAYRYARPATSLPLMVRLREKAEERLNFVYLGNLGMENDTRCPNCGETAIRRNFYRTESRIVDSSCPSCRRIIPGVFPG